jgi:hypothetical protein
MARTVYAARVSELKQRYLKVSRSDARFFSIEFNCLYAFSALGRLSRHNVIWLGKAINEMMDHWTSPEEREQLDRLQERQQRAWARWQKRIEDRAAAKEAKAKKTSDEPPAPVPPPADEDVWNL